MSAIFDSERHNRDLRFFRNLIFAMAIIIVAGFGIQLAAGRSSFSAPLIVHVHAVLFMGWVVITVLQAWLASAGNLNFHRRLGIVAAIWACVMMVVGPLVTIGMAHNGRVPPVFQPQYLLIADPATLVAFFGLLASALALRHRPDWHARLQIGAFMMLMGPGVGRILPMPLLIPNAFQVACSLPLIIAVIGMVRDWRVHGRPHPAWLVSIAVLALTLAAAQVLVFSPLGDAIYAASTAGGPAEGTNGLAFPQPPHFGP